MSIDRRCLAGLVAVLTAAAPRAAYAFCGFYVGKADAQLFNQSSQVALVRDGDRTVLTMSNDYKGEPTDFALVVPVPVVLDKEQIHIGDRKLVERLDAYSAPRLVEYFDSNPCEMWRHSVGLRAAPAAGPAKMAMTEERSRSLGVTIEAQFTVGEYDIVILSAKESEGLEIWLRESGYKIPPKASKALAPYIKQDMKFFVAKVNLKEQAAAGFSYLRPIQMAYESRKFMLPIRLGMANADGPQDLIIYTLTRKGRVESTNYRTVKMPTGMDIPVFVKGEFGPFYKATFATAHKKEDQRAILTEYLWDMGWCDPCAADPLSPEELKQLGVFWLDEPAGAASGMPMARRQFAGGAVPVILTRLHARYDGHHFPEDLMFQETGDRTNFQARYVLRHGWKGTEQCPEMDNYRRQLADRRRREAETLANMTGWELAAIYKKMGPDAPGEPPAKDPWYKKLWK